MLLGGIIDSGEDLIDRHLFDHALRHDVVEIRAEQLPPPVSVELRWGESNNDVRFTMCQTTTQENELCTYRAKKVPMSELIEKAA